MSYGFELPSVDFCYRRIQHFSCFKIGPKMTNEPAHCILIPFTYHRRSERQEKVSYIHARTHRGWGQGSGHPLKNHKNIGFLSNTSPDPLKNCKATKPAFNVGPSSALQRNAIDGPLNGVLL